MRLRLSAAYMWGYMACDTGKTQQAGQMMRPLYCVALLVLFRKTAKRQSPPTLFPPPPLMSPLLCERILRVPRSPVDANVPPVASRIPGMLFEICPGHTGGPIVPLLGRVRHCEWWLPYRGPGGFASRVLGRHGAVPLLTSLGTRRPQTISSFILRATHRAAWRGVNVTMPRRSAHLYLSVYSCVLMIFRLFGLWCYFGIYAELVQVNSPLKWFQGILLEQKFQPFFLE